MPNRRRSRYEDIGTSTTYAYYSGDLVTDDVEKIYVDIPDVKILNYKDGVTHPVIIKGHISVFNDILEEIGVMKCIMNEEQEDDWNNLVEYQTLTER